MGVTHSDGTVGKALALLDTVAGFGRPVRFAEVQEVSDLPKATLYRLLQTLTSQRMLSYEPDRGTYQPGLRLVQLAHSAWRQTTLAPVARPHLDALSAKLGETVHLAQLDGGQVLYVDKRNARRPIPMFSDAGKIGPGYCTGVGKAMLAFLPEAERARALAQQSYFPHTEHTHRDAESLEAELAEIRASGISFDREEHEPTIICVAVPILDERQRPIGAMSVTSSTLRHSLDDLAQLAPALKTTAAAISREAAGLSLPSAPDIA
ncbi:IclR family transcriptional regulator [Pontivivens ytuae]|uniref:IclR family transcriptional regulator n=1 Tax=Pontivivens ytuae TaxID=2789856 RepID=A0A7S9LU20_9RHOB|nr:IclR family transcriptional regulator [Pontivivens ytuae]QPH55269.1 IclR family transcriptional regulator [Pontivivens ytuae]